MSYVPRRPVLEAIKVEDALANFATEPAWLQQQLNVGMIALRGDHIEVQTNLGMLKALPGLYLIYDPATGALSVMTAELFEKLYEVRS